MRGRAHVMILGVMSDTHGNTEFMQWAADRMIHEFRVEAIVHLGDDYADAQRLALDGVNLYAVPGLFEAAWKDPSVPHRLIEEFGGIRFLLSHTSEKDSHDRPDDIDPGQARGLGAQVLLHGHTHRPRAVEAVDGLIVVNPGHLKADVDRGTKASFAIIDADFPKLSVEFYEVRGSLVDSRLFSFSPPCPPKF